MSYHRKKKKITILLYFNQNTEVKLGKPQQMINSSNGLEAIFFFWARCQKTQIMKVSVHKTKQRKPSQKKY